MGGEAVIRFPPFNLKDGMKRYNKIQGENSLSAFKQMSDRTQQLTRTAKEYGEKYQALQEDYKRLQKDFSDIEKKQREIEDKYKKLLAEFERTKKELSDMSCKETRERYLKNNAYAFIVSQGYEYNYKLNLWQKKQE